MGEDFLLLTEWQDGGSFNIKQETSIFCSESVSLVEVSLLALFALPVQKFHHHSPASVENEVSLLRFHPALKFEWVPPAL